MKNDANFLFVNMSQKEKKAILIVAKIVEKYFNVSFKNTKIVFKNVNVVNENATGSVNLYENCVYMKFFKRKSFSAFILAACHEFVHVKQYVSDGFKTFETKILFQNKVYGISEIETNYKNTPWEIEAYATQEKLFSIFAQKCPKDILKILCKEYNIPT